MKLSLLDRFAFVDKAISDKDEARDKILVCADTSVYASISGLNGEAYAPFCDETIEKKLMRVYVPTLDMPDKDIDKLIEYTLENKAKLAVRCNSTLTEAGLIDARFGKSPVMLLYEFGLLEYSTVISGVYLDKDDLSLMAQQGVSLTVLPTEDAGYGRGVAPVCAALERGVKIGIGSGDGAFNRPRDVLYEAKMLGLLASAQMNKANAVSGEDLARMCLPPGASQAQVQALAHEITDK